MDKTYIILNAQSDFALMAQVMEALSDGYKLEGGVSATVNSQNGDKNFYQAMTYTQKVEIMKNGISVEPQRASDADEMTATNV
jgi:hypothetical protein